MVSTKFFIFTDVVILFIIALLSMLFPRLTMSLSVKDVRHTHAEMMHVIIVKKVCVSFLTMLVGFGNVLLVHVLHRPLINDIPKSRQLSVGRSAYTRNIITQ